jgi:hypothetical protein
MIITMTKTITKSQNNTSRKIFLKKLEENEKVFPIQKRYLINDYSFTCLSKKRV